MCEQDKAPLSDEQERLMDEYFESMTRMAKIAAVIMTMGAVGAFAFAAWLFLTR